MGLKCIGLDLYGLKWVYSVDEWVCTVSSSSVLLNVGLQYKQVGLYQIARGKLKYGKLTFLLH